MPVVDPEHHDTQAGRYRAVVNFRTNTGLVTSVGADQRFVQHRQTTHLGELLDRGIDAAQRLLLAAVVVSQDVVSTYRVVLQMVALGEFGDARGLPARADL